MTCNKSHSCILILVPLTLALTQAAGVAQNYGAANQNYSSGFGGRASNNTFNGGFSGLAGQAQGQAANPSQYRPAARQTGQSTMASLEQTLNAVDNPTGWSRTPVSPAPGTRMPQAPANARTQARPRQGMFPGISRKDMMRVFLEGGTPQPSGSPWGAAAPQAGSSANTSTAYSNYQRAASEATRARNYANTARYDSSQWNRKDAATQAEYAANNADYAAQRAEAAAYSGDSQARGYANLARQSANQARANANQARYNADTIR
jgi:hypothetical protein